MRFAAKALLACGLLVYAASVFMPWLESSLIGGATITYWSFKAEIHPYPYPYFAPPYQVMFWSLPSYWTAIFISQILALLFGVFTLLKKLKGKRWSTFLGLTLLFTTASIAICTLHSYGLSGRLVISFKIGFWMASIALLLLIGSLLVTRSKYFYTISQANFSVL